MELQWLIYLTLTTIVIIVMSVINNSSIREELHEKAEKEMYVYSEEDYRRVEINTLIDLILKELDVNLTHQPELKLTKKKKGKR